MLWTPEVVPEQLAGLARARTFPLRSSFAPEYNMAVNLLGRMGLSRAQELLHRSFAQFQADRSVVGQACKLDDARLRLRKTDAQLSQLAAERGVDQDGTESASGFLSYIDLRGIFAAASGI